MPPALLLFACSDKSTARAPGWKGAILPSYDVETMLLDTAATESMGLYASIALVMVVCFSVLEFVELLYYGAWTYLCDMWNLMDWGNFIIFYMVFLEVTRRSVEGALPSERCCRLPSTPDRRTR